MNKEPLNPNRWILRWLPAFVGVLIVIFSAATIVAVFLAMADGAVKPAPFLSIEYWIGKNENTSRSEVVRNLGLALAAFIGLAVAFWRLALAGKQQTLAERSFITDRINKAVENLGHRTTAIKLGGVHALSRLIEEVLGRDRDAQRRDVEMILDILTSFVRHNAKERVSYDKNGKLVLRIDVETAVQLLGDGNASYRSVMPKDYKLNLSNANLPGARLSGCDFQNMAFFDANLSGAVLFRANFSGTFLASAKFNAAGMHGAILTDANLSAADFTGATGMTQKQIDSAFWREDLPPTLPEYLTQPPQKPEEEE